MMFNCQCKFKLSMMLSHCLVDHMMLYVPLFVPSYQLSLSPIISAYLFSSSSSFTSSLLTDAYDPGRFHITTKTLRQSCVLD